MQTIYILKALK